MKLSFFNSWWAGLEPKKTLVIEIEVDTHQKQKPKENRIEIEISWIK